MRILLLLFLLAVTVVVVSTRSHSSVGHARSRGKESGHRHALSNDRRQLERKKHREQERKQQRKLDQEEAKERREQRRLERKEQREREEEEAKEQRELERARRREEQAERKQQREDEALERKARDDEKRDQRRDRVDRIREEVEERRLLDELEEEKAEHEIRQQKLQKQLKESKSDTFRALGSLAAGFVQSYVASNQSQGQNGNANSTAVPAALVTPAPPSTTALSVPASLTTALSTYSNDRPSLSYEDDEPTPRETADQTDSGEPESDVSQRRERRHHRANRHRRAPASRYSILEAADGPVLGVDALLNLPELTPANLDKFVGKDDGTAEESMVALKFMAKYGLISNSMECPLCKDVKMVLIKDSKKGDGYYWRCKACRNQKVVEKVHVRRKSYFEEMRITLPQALKLIASWAAQPGDTCEQVARNLDISPKTAVAHFKLLREITELWVEANCKTQFLGGPNKTVEIDESLFYKAKFNRGRLLTKDPVWVFGAIERGTDKMAAWVVPNRTALTLLPIIKDHVLPGTRVVSDGWAAYGGISQLQQQYNHLVVNHKLHFVDPKDRSVHTQSIEATWGAMKRSLKATFGLHRDSIPSYIADYMFRRAHKRDHIFARILKEILKLYPV